MKLYLCFQYRTKSYAKDTFDSYLYQKNLQGDIVAIYNTSGTQVAKYTYDAWGNIRSSSGSMASINPFRYRGYYFDQETNFYYLQSRYYDPAIGRFISADTANLLLTTPSELTDTNLYAYCDNNPVIRADDDGEFWHVIAGALISGIFELGSQLISNGWNWGEVNWTKVAVSTVVGGVTAACGPFAGTAISALVAGTESMIEDGVDDPMNLLKAIAIDVTSSLVGIGISKAVSKIGGKIMVSNLAKKSPNQIKTTVCKAINVAGKDRNLVKNLSWTLSQKAYKDLPEALVGKFVPQIFDSTFSNAFGYVAGGIYGH